jgi:hypothetical protein
MRVLTSMLEGATLALFHTWPPLACGGPVALPLLRADDAWHIHHAREPRVEERLRRWGVPTTLHQAIEHLPIRLDGPPPLMALTSERQKHRLQMPRVARSRPSAPAPIGLVLPARQTPVADGFRGDVDAAFEPQRWHVAGAHGKAIVAPAPVAAHFAGKATLFGALGVGGRSHARLPLCACCVMDPGRQQRGDYVMGSRGRSTS